MGKSAGILLDLIRKPIVLIAGICGICCICLLTFFVFKPFTIYQPKLVETSSGIVTITQAYVSISATGADSKEGAGNKPDMAILQYSPLVNFTSTKEITKFKIQNVKLTNPINSGKTFITWPKHFAGGDNNTFYEPMDTPQNFLNRKDEGNAFEYKVVDIARYTDEISKWGSYVDFRYTIYQLGEPIDYEGIMNRTGIYSGGKELQYAGFEKGEINSPIEFDVVIDFKDNTQAIKHFSLTSDFNEIYEQGFSFKYNSDEYVGKQF